MSFLKGYGKTIFSVFKRAIVPFSAYGRMEREKNTLLLREARDAHRAGGEKDKALISVLIPTYNRGKVLAERTVPSILRQTYGNFEIVIVGDHVSDDTGELLKGIGDKRIKFLNLPARGTYPENPDDRWKVAGVVPMNRAIELASGDWIAPLDDDDEFSDDHLEVLLKHALEHGHEMVYGKVAWEKSPGAWTELGAYPLRHGRISHLAVLYSAKLKFFKYDINSWKYGEPADWNMWRRMKESGVKIGFLAKTVGKHYLEKNQVKEKK